MVVVAQLVRALDCGSRGRGFESRLPPIKPSTKVEGFLVFGTEACFRFQKTRKDFAHSAKAL